VKILFRACGNSKEDRLPAREEGEDGEDENEEKEVLVEEEEEKRLRICPQSPSTPLLGVGEGNEEVAVEVEEEEEEEEEEGGAASLLEPLKAKGLGRASHESLMCGVKKVHRDCSLFVFNLWLRCNCPLALPLVYLGSSLPVSLSFLCELLIKVTN